MILSFREIIKKYFKRNKKYLLSENILHEMNGVVLYRTNIEVFNFNSHMIEEVKAYCEEQGYDIDKVVYVSSYDLDLKDGPKLKIKMQGDSKISIIKEDDNIIARVCICEQVQVKDRWESYV